MYWFNYLHTNINCFQCRCCDVELILGKTKTTNANMNPASTITTNSDIDDLWRNIKLFRKKFLILRKWKFESKKFRENFRASKKQSRRVELNSNLHDNSEWNRLTSLSCDCQFRLLMQMLAAACATANPISSLVSSGGHQCKFASDDKRTRAAAS